jgi:hypothetical protein
LTQSAAKHANGETEARAKALVNPTSGLANDYLNVFNELVMLVEMLPNVPEFAEDIFAWRPKTYREYFEASTLPGSKSALEAYAKLDSKFRSDFEDVMRELERFAIGSVVAIRLALKKGESAREALVAHCEKTSTAMRDLLQKASNLIDHGSAITESNAQDRADRLIKVRVQAIKDVQQFYSRPRFS